MDSVDPAAGEALFGPHPGFDGPGRAVLGWRPRRPEQRTDDQPNTGPHGICRHALYWTLVTASGAHRVEVGGVFAFPAISARRPRS